MMQRTDRMNRMTWTVLAIAGAAVAMPDIASAQEAPETVTLTGVVRDFRDRDIPGGHPDFELPDGVAGGHWAGNVSHFLSSDGKPVYTGQGSVITADYRDSGGRPIARHLYEPSAASPVVPAGDSIILKDSKGVDAFRITFVGVTYNGDGTSTWRYRVRELSSGKDLSHWNVALHPSQVVMPGTTPGFDTGIDGSTGFYGIKWDVDDGFADQEFVIVLDKHYAGSADNTSILAKGGSKPDTGKLYAPIRAVVDAGASGAGGSDDDAFPRTAGEYPYSSSKGDSAGAAGAAHDGFVDSATSFDQWFRDIPGVNLSRPLAITLRRDGASGHYVFDDRTDPAYAAKGGFFPIDGQLFGDDGNPHNYHFTYELAMDFVYREGTGQVFTFRGDDDVWVYVDDRLVIDIGGIHNAIEQTIDMDRLAWLEDGETYKLRFFFAERNLIASNFRLETNIELHTGKPPATSGLFD
jgi:fibro-slime domain-containing protein